MGELDGKVALVTGGASGIGLATARRLAAAGAEVVIGDLGKEPCERAASEVRGSSVVFDVGDPEAWGPAMEEVRARHGGLDIAHLNAGVSTGVQVVDEVTDDQYRRIMGANVDGVFYGMRAVVPEIAARGGGAIVVTASMAGLIAFSPDPVYCATKHAVVGLVRAAAPQLEERGITLNAICPGMVDTPLVDGQLRELLEEAKFPLIAPEEIAEAVLGCILGGDTAQALVCQAGREPTPYRFAGVPGPGGDFEGRTPPAGAAAEDQLLPGS